MSSEGATGPRGLTWQHGGLQCTAEYKSGIKNRHNCEITAVMQASMRSLSCLKRLMPFQGMAGVHFDAILTSPPRIPDIASCRAISAISFEGVVTPDQENRAFRESRLGFSTDTGIPQDSSSSGGDTHFQRILQHPSTEFGSEASASSIPEEDPEDAEGDAEGDDAQELRERLLKAALAHVVQRFFIHMIAWRFFCDEAAHFDLQE